MAHKDTGSEQWCIAEPSNHFNFKNQFWNETCVEKLTKEADMDEWGVYSLSTKGN